MSIAFLTYTNTATELVSAWGMADRQNPARICLRGGNSALAERYVR
jgi:hypothetical protein